MATNFDYASIRQRIIDSLKTKQSWADVSFFGTNTKLIDSFSEEEAYLALYREFLNRELTWVNTQNISYAVYLSSLLGYTPHRKNSSQGVLKVSTSETFDSSYPNIIDIPRFTNFSNSEGSINFVNIIPFQLTPSDNFIDIDIIQGIVQNITFSALGDVNELYSVVNPSIEDTFFEVFVNDIPYETVDNLSIYTPTDKVVQLKNRVDFSGVDLKFGDGINGRKLLTGETVKINYIVTLGVDGDILSSNTVTNVNTPIFDQSNLRVELFVTNEEQIIGGSNVESLSSIKANAPQNYQSGNRAITKDNYKFFIDTYPAVSKSLVWGAYELNIDSGNSPWTYVPAQKNYVYITALTNTFTNLTEDQKNDITDILLPLKPPTDLLKFEDTNIINIVFSILAFTSNTAISAVDLKTSINQTLIDNYSVENLDFFESIYESDYIALIDNIENVNYHKTTFTLFEDSFSFTDPSYVSEFSLSLYPLTPESVKVYVKTDSTDYVLIAIDDGANGWTGQEIPDSAPTEYFQVQGDVNYITGTGVIVVTSGLTETYTDYQIKIDYGTVSRDIELKLRNQILNYSTSSDISVLFI